MYPYLREDKKTDKMHIKISDYVNHGGYWLKLFDELEGATYDVFPDATPEVTPDIIEDSDFYSGCMPKWTAKSIEGNDRLVGIALAMAGFDHVDVPALDRAGIMLCNSPGAVKRPVAISVLTLMLALGLRLMQKDRLLRQGHWDLDAAYIGSGFLDKTLGGIGVGNIGHEVFRMAGPLGMRHIAHDPYVKPEAVSDVGVELVDLNTVMAESDYLFISVLLNQETHHLIGEKELGLMKPTAYLINMARGAVIHEAALIKILEQRKIQGAGLDVFEQEPTPKDNPLLSMDHVIVSPHKLAEMEEFYTYTWAQKVRQIQQMMRGDAPESLVNPEVLQTEAHKERMARLRERLG